MVRSHRLCFRQERRRGHTPTSGPPAPARPGEKNCCGAQDMPRRPTSHRWRVRSGCCRDGEGVRSQRKHRKESPKGHTPTSCPHAPARHRDKNFCGAQDRPRSPTSVLRRCREAVLCAVRRAWTQGHAHLHLDAPPSLCLPTRCPSHCSQHQSHGQRCQHEAHSPCFPRRAAPSVCVPPPPAPVDESRLSFVLSHLESLGLNSAPDPQTDSASTGLAAQPLPLKARLLPFSPRKEH